MQCRTIILQIKIRLSIETSIELCPETPQGSALVEIRGQPHRDGPTFASCLLQKLGSFWLVRLRITTNLHFKNTSNMEGVA